MSDDAPPSGRGGSTANGNGVLGRLRSGSPVKLLLHVLGVLVLFGGIGLYNVLELPFPLFQGNILLGFVLLGLARVYEASEQGDLDRSRATALFAITIGTALVVIGLLSEFGTLPRLGTTTVGVAVAAVGALWNRRLLQARRPTWTDERLEMLTFRAGYRAAQVVFALVVAVLTVALVVAPTYEAPVVLLLVAFVLVGALSYAVSYGYYEVQY